MKPYYDWDQLREDAISSSRNGQALASEIDQAVNIGNGKVFIRMEHTEQRGIMLTLDELRTIIKEVEDLVAQPPTIHERCVAVGHPEGLSMNELQRLEVEQKAG